MAKDGRETILTPNSTPSIEPTLKPIATTTESAYEVPEAGSSPFALPQAEVGINRSNRDAKRQRDDSLEIPNKRSSNHKTTAQRNSPGTAHAYAI